MVSLTPYLNASHLLNLVSQSFVYALYDLVDCPEYTTLLRDEIASCPTDWWLNVDNLPLLDSFLKESARMNPSDSISLRRKALTRFTFSDGTVVPKGAWVCVPQRAMQRDPSIYANPEVFNGHRFIDQDRPFTELTTQFPFWGMGKHSWYVRLNKRPLNPFLIIPSSPGRFYAVAILKMMIGTVIEKYDIDLDHGLGPKERTFTWRTAVIPRSSIKLKVQERRKGVEQAW